MRNEEQLTPNQSMTAGDGSNNYQAGRDIHVHGVATEPAPSSSIVRPTNEQITKFDPKTAKIISAARKIFDQSMGWAILPLGSAIVEMMKSILAMLR
jgi:hypothetical protein